MLLGRGCKINEERIKKTAVNLTCGGQLYFEDFSLKLFLSKS